MHIRMYVCMHVHNYIISVYCIYVHLCMYVT